MDSLYGRDDLLARARRSVERACAGEGSVLLLTGEAGIGKSRLSEHIALEGLQRGMRVARGRCWEVGGAPAYWPWLQLFRSLELDTDAFSGAKLQLAMDAPDTRFALYDRVVRTLQNVAHGRPLLVILDDLHAADAPSLMLLLLLVRQLAHASILVVGAYRDAELPLTPELAPLLEKLARESEVMPLSRLSPGHVAEWLRVEQADSTPSHGSDLYALTEGHPLLVVEALRLGRGASARATWSRGPGGVLQERLARLTASTRDLLESAAVLGREFSLEELANTAGAHEDDVHRALAEAVAIDLVQREGVQLRFSHVLLRDRLYGALLPSRRQALHASSGEALLRLGKRPQEVVHHFFESGDASAPERVTEIAVCAAEDALAQLAFEQAEQLARRALALRHDLPPAQRAQLELIVGEALIRLGQSAQGKSSCLVAAARAEQAGSPELLARAALVYGTELASGLIDPRMIALLRQSLAALDARDSALRARVMARLAAALTPPQQAEDGVEILSLSRGAVAMARRLGDPLTLLQVLQFASTIGLLVDQHERFALLEEAFELARVLDHKLVLLHTYPVYITALLALGERLQAEQHLAAYGELLADFAQPGFRLRYLLTRAVLLTVGGDRAGAEQISMEARALTAELPPGPPRLVFLIHRLTMAQLHGEPELIAPDVPALLALHERNHRAVPYSAWFLAGLGRAEEARRHLALTDIALSDIVSFNLWELQGAAEACVLLGDAELGAVIYPRLVHAADRMFWSMSPGAVVGPSARTLGSLAAFLGKFPEAVAHYDDAIAFCEKMRAPLLVDSCKRAREGALAMSAGKPAPTVHAPAVLPAPLVLRHEGEIWTVTSTGGQTVRLRHSKGLLYLQVLLEQPGREIHVLELAGIEHRTGDAGPVLDAKAKAAYRERFAALREELADAERCNDVARARAAEHEIEAIAEQLAGAVGLGGRDRRAASEVERTRINVQRRLKDAVDRIAASHPELGRYLSAALKTGTFCVYRPL